MEVPRKSLAMQKEIANIENGKANTEYVKTRAQFYTTLTWAIKEITLEVLKVMREKVK